MGALPSFTDDGVFPPGDYEMTFEEVRESFLVTGDGLSVTWDSGWRAWLVDNLEIMVDQLHQVGVWEIFIDGSFVEEKDHPNDIDGYFHCTLQDVSSGNLVWKLNQIDPHQVWTWDPQSRTSASGTLKKQLPMWHQYRVELYPHFGQGSAIWDNYGQELTFPSAFRRTRSGAQKGLIKLQ